MSKKISLTAIIEVNDNGFWSIIGDRPICGCRFAGYGHTEVEAKQDFYDGIVESLDMARDRNPEITITPNDIEVLFKHSSL